MLSLYLIGILQLCVAGGVMTGAAAMYAQPPPPPPPCWPQCWCQPAGRAVCLHAMGAHGSPPEWYCNGTLPGMLVPGRQNNYTLHVCCLPLHATHRPNGSPPLQTNKSLESERAFARKLGEQAAQTKGELQVGGPADQGGAAGGWQPSLSQVPHTLQAGRLWR